MKYNEFIGKVQHRAELPTQSDAVAATRATLSVLSERLVGNEAQNLAAQLPQEIGHYLKQDAPNDTFDLESFFERVQKREGVDMPDAVYHARVVMSVVQEAVTPGEIANVRAQLPPDYAPLFEAGAEGSIT